MASLQEILAKKKAAEAQKELKASAEVSTLENIKPKESLPVSDAGASTAASPLVTKTVAEPVKKEEVAVVASPKLSFKEMMELKKKQAASSNEEKKPSESPAPAAKPLEEEPAPILALEEEQTQSQVPAKEIDTAVSTAKIALTPTEVNESLRTGMLDARLDPNMPAADVPAEVAQAATDIRDKINLLTEMSGEDLVNAMKNLKTALMKNPAAVDLMEDTDIGKMVIALRKITGETIAEAVKEKKGGGGSKKKTTNIDLTDPNVVAQIFDEL